MVGIMESRMETTLRENQMEKKMENEMETTTLYFELWGFTQTCILSRGTSVLGF